MIKKVLISIIKTYQYIISPLIGQNCRFIPSCSNYAIDSIKNHGILYGIFLTIIRILKCNPYIKGGKDFISHKN
ncbi:Putative membrane protein insertion efficiency factor [Candidatus Kinetoplastibacterium sorsogonicusi]|uniref:Putative membrane protein insertion efficiency factor n=1 Tax=Candidatus Kinetoplastidibacterium kentomonadis TaxID=1576550 RepID=A0A3Q8EYH6_9PROT|nr:membrane protein insertion efficiency factor YidD [Candidatus Kinetoplastibacterium sorsogonicusi]AWD32815.1 Putative membrane protein insertion efficiency factor [Candidatus Kinetoplastibacterium sorsogonicusi]